MTMHFFFVSRLANVCLLGWDAGDIWDMDVIFLVLEMPIWLVDWMIGIVGTFATWFLSFDMNAGRLVWDLGQRGHYMFV